MKLLLDTHAFIWWREDSRRLVAAARRAIADAEIVFVSAASCWEIAIKASLGRFDFPGTLLEAIGDSDFSPLPIDIAHAECVRRLPLLRRDPFDRMLVAQAIVEHLTLVTHDATLARYAVETLKT